MAWVASQIMIGCGPALPPVDEGIGEFAGGCGEALLAHAHHSRHCLLQRILNCPWQHPQHHRVQPAESCSATHRLHSVQAFVMQIQAMTPDRARRSSTALIPFKLRSTHRYMGSHVMCIKLGHHLLHARSLSQRLCNKLVLYNASVLLTSGLAYILDLPASSLSGSYN